MWKSTLVVLWYFIYFITAPSEPGDKSVDVGEGLQCDIRGLRPPVWCLTEVTYDKYLMICNEPEIYIFNKNVNSFVFTMWLWVPPPGHLSGCVGNSLATIGYSYMPIYLAIVFELSYAKKTTSRTMLPFYHKTTQDGLVKHVQPATL